MFDILSIGCFEGFTMLLDDLRFLLPLFGFKWYLIASTHARIFICKAHTCVHKVNTIVTWKQDLFETTMDRLENLGLETLKTEFWIGYEP
jgi:hypothetical protein